MGKSKKEKEEEKELEYEELDEEEKDFSDDYDIIESFQKVHGKTEWDLNENFTISIYDSQEQKAFIARQHELALLAWSMIMGDERHKSNPDPAVSKNALRGYHLMMAMPTDIALINRNSKNNPFLTGILDKPSKNTPETTEEQKGIIAGTMKTMGAFIHGKKKEEPEP